MGKLILKVIIAVFAILSLPVIFTVAGAILAAFGPLVFGLAVIILPLVLIGAIIGYCSGKKDQPAKLEQKEPVKEETTE